MHKTVLIVEDEYLIASELQCLLEKHGWQVLGPVATVAHALAALDDELPGFALLDINLGDELVTPVAVLLKERGIPFAVASAYARPEQYGGAAFDGAPNVGKPTTERRLLAVLAGLGAC